MTAHHIAADLIADCGHAGALRYLVPRLFRCTSWREARGCVALIAAVIRT